MFQYLENKKKFVIKLGQYVSHEIISKNKNHNDLDRLHLAYTFLESLSPYYEHYLNGSIQKEDLVFDLAIYIDQRIPKSYVKWRDKLHDTSPSEIITKNYKTDLIYHFEENRHLSSVEDMEDKKLIQLYKNLDSYYEQIYGSNYHFTPNSLRQEGICSVIQYLTNKGLHQANNEDR